jgi:hypothetical protein
MIVFTKDVVDQLIAGLKAGQAEREAAAKTDTPYGRYKTAEAAYIEAQPKCEAGQQAFYQRAGANPKMLDKYSELTNKMVAAQTKGDRKLQAIYEDSAKAMLDPSCVVKQPELPNDYYATQRAFDVQAEEKEMQASGFNGGELAMMKERAIAILGGAPAPGGASASEKAAVTARSAELKPLLGIREQPKVAAKPAAAPAPPPAPAPATPQMSAATSNMSSCMTNNVLAHQAEIEALGKRAEVAQEAGDTPKLMAIADTMQRIQMAGCQGR